MPTDQATTRWAKVGAWGVSILAVVAVLGAVVPQFVGFYVCPDWDLKGSPTCAPGGVEIGPLLSLAIMASTSLFLVAPVLLILAVVVSVFGGKK